MIVLGTADELKDRVGGGRIEITVTTPADIEPACQTLTWLAVGAASLSEAPGRLAGQGIAVRDAGLRRPSLDGVFPALTGHGTTAAQDDKGGQPLSRAAPLPGAAGRGARRPARAPPVRGRPTGGGGEPVPPERPHPPVLIRRLGRSVRRRAGPRSPPGGPAPVRPPPAGTI